jgi:hypothetical protein
MYAHPEENLVISNLFSKFMRQPQKKKKKNQKNKQKFISTSRSQPTPL